MDPPPPLSPVFIAAALETSRMIQFSAHTLLIYDFFLKLPDELRYMWRSDGGIGRMLYLLTRYMSLASLLAEMTFSHRTFTSLGWCKAVWRFLGIFTMISLFAAESIFLLRCLAQHRQSRTWMRTIWLLFLLTFITFCSLVIVWTLRAQYLPLPIPLNVCGVLVEAKYLYPIFALLGFWQYAAATLAFIKARRITQVTNRCLRDVLWDDGFQYYIFILVTTTFNLLAVGVANLQMSAILYRALTTLASARLLLHVRRVAELSLDIHQELQAPEFGNGSQTLGSALVRTDRHTSSQSLESKKPPSHPSSAIELSKV